MSTLVHLNEKELDHLMDSLFKHIEDLTDDWRDYGHKDCDECAGGDNQPCEAHVDDPQRAVESKALYEKIEKHKVRLATARERAQRATGRIPDPPTTIPPTAGV